MLLSHITVRGEQEAQSGGVAPFPDPLRVLGPFHLGLPFCRLLIWLLGLSWGSATSATHGVPVPERG